MNLHPLYINLPVDYCKDDAMSTADVNILLKYVKAKFSDVLIPMESINKQHSLGKG